MSDTKTPESVEMPSPTASPLIFSVGIALLGAGIGLHLGFLVVGAIVFVFGLSQWIGQLLPGQGHEYESLRPPHERAVPPVAVHVGVESLRPGAVGYRFRLPEHVHPISSGAWGGLVGGLLMPIPAMLYGLLDQGSPWLPINLLAGMVIPGITEASIESLKQFSLAGLALGTVIHFAFSITFGLMYGVILPMLPPIRGGAVIFGGVVMPIVWSGICYGLMGIVNPLLEEHVNWPWFVASQFVYGVAMSLVVARSEKVAVSQAPPMRGKRTP